MLTVMKSGLMNLARIYQILKRTRKRTRKMIKKTRTTRTVSLYHTATSLMTRESKICLTMTRKTTIQRKANQQ